MSTDIAPTSQVHTTATHYTVSALPLEHREAGHFSLTVEWRGDGRWAVCRGRMCLDADGVADFESQPSSRADAWLAAHRFDLDTALALAVREAPGLTCNGYTVADVLRTTPEEN